MASEEGMSITLKRRESERYAGNGSWLVLHGTPRSIKQYIGEAFGFDVENLTLVEASTHAERLWQSEDSTKLRAVSKAPQSEAVATVVKTLDGEVVEETATDDPWAISTPAGNVGAAEAAPADPVLAAIEKATSKPELQAIYLENKERFAEEGVAAAAKAKAGAL